MDWSITSGAVPIQRRMWGVSATLMTVSAVPAARPKATAVWMASSTLSCSPAPKCREMTTPAPMEMPAKNPTSKNTSDPEELTAASACLPRKLPTISESTEL